MGGRRLSKVRGYGRRGCTWQGRQVEWGEGYSSNGYSGAQSCVDLAMHTTIQLNFRSPHCPALRFGWGQHLQHDCPSAAAAAAAQLFKEHYPSPHIFSLWMQ